MPCSTLWLFVFTSRCVLMCSSILDIDSVYVRFPTSIPTYPVQFLLAPSYILKQPNTIPFPAGACESLYPVKT